jgi:hypothetical protein
VPRVRRFRPGQEIDHRTSPNTRKVRAEVDDLALSWMSCKVHRTRAVLSAMPALLLELWREQHPKGHEQTQLDFIVKRPAAKPVQLFPEEEGIDRS